MFASVTGIGVVLVIIIVRWRSGRVIKNLLSYLRGCMRYLKNELKNALLIFLPKTILTLDNTVIAGKDTTHLCAI
jgi:hypothetical protein